MDTDDLQARIIELEAFNGRQAEKIDDLKQERAWYQAEVERLENERDSAVGQLAQFKQERGDE